MADEHQTAQARELGAWLRIRLGGDEARREWTSIVETSWDQLLTLPLSQAWPPEAVQKLVEAYLTPDRLADLARPVVSKLLPALAAGWRHDNLPLGRWVPDSARGAIERIVTRPDLVHEDWIRALFRQKVVEAVMADTLYRGIRDFSTIMPRLMLSLMPAPGFMKRGSAGVGKRLVEQLEKKIEPEIKAFLKGGTKRALDHAADFAVEHRDDTAALAFRRNVVQFVLSKTPSFHAHGLTPEVLHEATPVVEQIARHMATRDETKTMVREVIEQVATSHGDKPVGELLKELGVEGRPDFDAWAEVTWPTIVAGLEAPAVVEWLDKLVLELLQERDRRSE